MIDIMSLNVAMVVSFSIKIMFEIVGKYDRQENERAHNCNNNRLKHVIVVFKRYFFLKKFKSV